MICCYELQLPYNVTLWHVGIAIAVVEKQHCVLFLLLSYLSLSTILTIIECCTEILSWRIYVAGNSITVVRYSCRVSRRISAEVPSIKFHGNSSSESSADT